MRGTPQGRDRAQVDEALDLVQLAGQAEKLPGQLSGGQQQRVAIARAIVIEPPLVLMDEPLSNLDAKLRLEMRAEIRRIHDSTRPATIYVTHDQDEALSLADRIVVMRDGVVRQVGTPEELYVAARASDVADFMGYRNVLESTVDAADGEACRVERRRRASIDGIASEPVTGGNASRRDPAGRICIVDADGPNVVRSRSKPSNIAAAISSARARWRDGTELCFRPHDAARDAATTHPADGRSASACWSIADAGQ